MKNKGNEPTERIGAESRSSSMVKIENDISIRSWAGLEQDLERDREHTGGPGATRGKRGAALWGWVPTTELAVGKSAPDACLRSAPKLTF